MIWPPLTAAGTTLDVINQPTRTSAWSAQEGGGGDSGVTTADRLCDGWSWTLEKTIWAEVPTHRPAIVLGTDS